MTTEKKASKIRENRKFVLVFDGKKKLVGENEIIRQPTAKIEDDPNGCATKTALGRSPKKIGPA